SSKLISSRRNPVLLHDWYCTISADMPLQSTLIRVKMAYSQCDHASPCSSCFFLLRASTRRRSEHSSQMVISDGSPHTLQTWRACSGRGSDCSRGTTFMFASRCTEAEGGP